MPSILPETHALDPLKAFFEFFETRLGTNLDTDFLWGVLTHLLLVSHTRFCLFGDEIGTSGELTRFTACFAASSPASRTETKYPLHDKIFGSYGGDVHALLRRCPSSEQIN
jgi:hypothetical protein